MTSQGRELTEEEREFFTLSDTVESSMEKRNSRAIIERFFSEGIITKAAIPITPDFSIAVQNVVITLTLKRRVPAGHPSLLVYPNEDGTLGSDAEKYPSEMYEGRLTYLIPMFLNVEDIAFKWRQDGCQYNPKAFTAVIWRERTLGAAILISKRGSIIFTGCAHIDLMLYLQQKILEKLRVIGIRDFVEPTPKLKNMVSSGMFPHPLCLALMETRFSEICRPIRKFSGLIIIHKSFHKRAVLAFPSGKLCHSGARHPDDIVRDMNAIYEMLYQCRVTPENERLERRCQINLEKNHQRHSRMPDPDGQMTDDEITDVFVQNESSEALELVQHYGTGS